EQPPEDVLQAIEHRTCAELGFADHHRVSVVHHDTDHLHVHIAISRVHPTTHRAHWPSHSKLALDRLRAA
ncbi:MAG: relaxase/mobilization nuclease domain-containing protein, partial [Sphingopyxis sp.]|nr:relaxase/mobilization nuclease domain-containing protein [Sphingopyxis sp.]